MKQSQYLIAVFQTNLSAANYSGQ